VSDDKKKDPFEPLKADIEARVRKAAREEMIKWFVILLVARKALGGR
jgi:hypothetical protein